MSARLSEEQIQARIVHLRDQETSGPARLFWLSFADDDGFRGACIVRAHGVTTACEESHRQGCNPGGQMLCVEIPDGQPIPEGSINRLMQREELEAGFGPCATPDEIEALR